MDNISLTSDFRNYGIFKVKCPDDKTKTNACSMGHTEGTVSSSHTQFLVFDKCGKSKKCTSGVCVPKLKIRKIGQSCNYNEDCETGYCSSNECKTLSEGQDCSILRKACENGMYCNSGVCKKYLKEGETDNVIRCGSYLAKNAEGKCVKYGTLDDGVTPSYGGAFACKSGLINESGACDSIETAPTCSSTSVTGKWKIGGDISSTTRCSSGTNAEGNTIYYYPLYSSAKKKLFDDFMEEYNELDIAELNSEDKYFSDKLKWKVLKKMFLYKNAEELQAAGFINSEGETADDKDCELEFILKQLSSKYMKINTLLFIILWLFI